MRLTIVHLSDLHLNANATPICPTLRPLAAAVCSIDPSCAEYIIALAGDLTYSGLPEEYESLKSFLDTLASYIREHNPNANVRYVAVPGNHDCVLPESEINLRAGRW